MKRTTEGLRDLLFDELEGFLCGDFDHDHVKSVTRATGAILATVAKDLEAMKMLRELKDDTNRPQSIADLNLNLILTHEKTKNIDTDQNSAV